MALNLQEQEQIDELKSFWNRYGNVILAAITVALFAFAAVRGWNWYEARQAGAAAGIYSQLTQAVEARNVEQVKQRSEDLFKQYGSTAYGQMAGLLTARAYVDAKDPAGAKGALQWVLANAQDPEFKLLAALRLSGLLLDEKANDAALKVLNDNAAKSMSPDMAGAFSDRRGDILLAQENMAGAKAEYEKALATLPQASPLRQLVQFKLDALGG